MSQNYNQTRSNEEPPLVIIIEDNSDHAAYLEDSINRIYQSFNVSPMVRWFQYFNNCINYLKSIENQEKIILSVWVDLYLGDYGNNRNPGDLLSELYSVLYGKTDQIFPISSLVNQSPELHNFTKKEDISSDNRELLTQLKDTLDNISNSRSMPPPDINHGEMQEIKSILYGQQLDPGVIDKIRLIDNKLDQLELDTNFQYMKLEKLVLEIQSATWILWVLVRISKKFSISEKLISILISILFGGSFTYIIIRLLEILE